jgi:hypothetical protein
MSANPIGFNEDERSTDLEWRSLGIHDESFHTRPGTEGAAGSHRSSSFGQRIAFTLTRSKQAVKTANSSALSLTFEVNSAGKTAVVD